MSRCSHTLHKRVLGHPTYRTRSSSRALRMPANHETACWPVCEACQLLEL
jgi:hypothetical protein